MAVSVIAETEPAPLCEQFPVSFMKYHSVNDTNENGTLHSSVSSFNKLPRECIIYMYYLLTWAREPVRWMTS
jgi:hypothetical protein